MIRRGGWQREHAKENTALLLLLAGLRSNSIAHGLVALPEPARLLAY